MAEPLDDPFAHIMSFQPKEADDPFAHITAADPFSRVGSPAADEQAPPPAEPDPWGANPFATARPIGAPEPKPEAPRDEGFLGLTTGALNRGFHGARQTVNAYLADRANRTIELLDKVDADVTAGKPIRFGWDVPMHDPRIAHSEGRVAMRKEALATLGEETAAIADRQRDSDKTRPPQVREDMSRAIDPKKGFLENVGLVWDQFKKDPITFIYSTGLESIVQQAPGLVAAVPAGMAAGGPGVMATMGASSAFQQYGSSILKALSDSGVDLSDPEAIRKATSDPAKMEEIRRKAVVQAAIVGGFDAVSAGLAGKLFPGISRIPGGPVAQHIANAPLQGALVQGPLGAAGSALGSIASGDPVDVADLYGEYFGEFFGTPGEIAAARHAGRIHGAPGGHKQFTAENPSPTEQFNAATPAPVADDPFAHIMAAPSPTASPTEAPVADRETMSREGRAAIEALPGPLTEVPERHVAASDRQGATLASPAPVEGPVAETPPAATPEAPARSVDDLGYYSAALEAAREWKQPRGTPQQAIKYLKSKGVKDAEIETTGLDKFLADKKSVTREELASFLEQNRTELKEATYRTATVERRPGSGRFDEAPGAEGPAKWREHSLVKDEWDPTNPTYAERVVHLPVNETVERWNVVDRDGKVRATYKDEETARSAMGNDERLERAGDVPKPDANFRSGHFPQPNIVGHYQASTQKDSAGNNVFALSQIQSDWGQRVREHGNRDQAKIDGLAQQLTDLKKGIGTYFDQLSALAKSVTPQKNEQMAMHARTGISYPASASEAMKPALEQLDRLQENYNRVRSEFDTATAAVPSHPLTSTTDQWTDTTLRRAIKDAVDSGAQSIAIPSGDTVLSYNPGDEHGMREFYDKIVPKNLRNIMRGYDPSIKSTKVATLKSHDGKKDLGKGFTVFPITDKVRAEVRGGQKMFAMTVGNEVADRIASGKNFNIHPVAYNKVLKTAQSMASMRPSDVSFYQATKIEPGVIPDEYSATIRDADGTELSISGPLKELRNTRAFYGALDGRPAIVSLRFDLAGDRSNGIRGEVAHESLHALWDSLPADVRAALLDHGDSLGILNTGLKTAFTNSRYMREAENVDNDVTLFEAYHKNYKSDTDYRDRMDQEVAAHMLQWYVTGALTPEQVAPVQHILDGMLNGDFARGSSAETSTGPMSALTGDEKSAVAEQKQRAEAQGFDTSTVYYHGTTVDRIARENPGSTRIASFKGRPFAGTDVSVVWLTPNPSFADDYNGSSSSSFVLPNPEGGMTIPVYVKPGKSLRFDANGAVPYSLGQAFFAEERTKRVQRDLSHIASKLGNNDVINSALSPLETAEDVVSWLGEGEYYSGTDLSEVPSDVRNSVAAYRRAEELAPEQLETLRKGAQVKSGTHDLLKYAKEHGYDTIYADNVKDGRSVGQQVLVLNDKNIRSVNAGFDPAKADRSGMMFSLTGDGGQRPKAERIRNLRREIAEVEKADKEGRIPDFFRPSDEHAEIIIRAQLQDGSDILTDTDINDMVRDAKASPGGMRHAAWDYVANEQLWGRKRLLASLTESKDGGQRPQSALSVIKDFKGIRDPQGELRAILGRPSRGTKTKGNQKGYLPGVINNQTGVPLDRAREILIEKGFLPQDADLKDMYNLIERMASGERVVAQHDQDAEDVYNSRNNEAVDRQLTINEAHAFFEENGLPYNLSPQEEDRVVELRRSGLGIDPAIERVTMESYDELTGTTQESSRDAQESNIPAEGVAAAPEDRAVGAQDASASAPRGEAAGESVTTRPTPPPLPKRGPPPLPPVAPRIPPMGTAPPGMPPVPPNNGGRGGPPSGPVPPAAAPAAGPTMLPMGPIARRFSNAIDRLGLGDVVRQLQLFTTPMAARDASVEQRAAAKDAANAMRASQYEWTRVIDQIKKSFTVEQQKAMWEAADEQSVMEQIAKDDPSKPVDPAKGLGRLTPEEQRLVYQLMATSAEVFERAKEEGMFKGEGLPSYVPRMVARMTGVVMPEGVGESRTHPKPLDELGGNIRTNSANLKHRKYLTTTETEAAARKAMGDENVEVVKNIMTLPLATARLENAIAGRRLINAVKQLSTDAGVPLVHEGGVPEGQSRADYFTIPQSAAFWTARPRLEKASDGKWSVVKNEAGEPIMDRTPIYVHREFEGPLRSIMSSDSSAAYRGYMALKAKSMSVIMISPIIHNQVEWGRALPAAPSKVMSGRIYFEGNKAKHDPTMMREAIEAGMAPIGHRAFMQDMTSIMEMPNLQPGRSTTSSIVSFVPGLLNKNAGESVKRAVDNAGDFWHNTMLWDRIGDLQMGLYVNLRDELMQKGFDKQTASRAAAHWANRYAGALPIEAMSSAATKFANVMLFSRTFTLGNIGSMKDMFVGLPRDVKSQIMRDMGPNALRDISRTAKNKARMIVAIDLAMAYIGYGILQSMVNVIGVVGTGATLGGALAGGALGARFGKTGQILGTAAGMAAGYALSGGGWGSDDEKKKLEEELAGYSRRIKKAANHIYEHPYMVLSPLKFLEDVGATGDNEPGRKDRILVGYERDGTAIYARVPTGKIGEEFAGWGSSALDMMHRKLSPWTRAASEIWSNDKGFGRKVYDKNAESPDEMVRNVARILTHLAAAPFPVDWLKSVKDAMFRPSDGARTTDILKAVGPLVGTTFSKGAPGGPAVGTLFREREKKDFAMQEALPDIRRLIEDKKTDEARKMMVDLGVSPKLRAYYLRVYGNPAIRLNSRRMQELARGLSPDDKELLKRQKDRSDAARRPSAPAAPAEDDPFADIMRR